MMDLEELHLSWWRGRSSRPDNQRAQKSDESEVSLDRQPHVCTIYTNFSVFTVSWSLAMLSGGGPIDSRLRIFLEWRCIGVFSEVYQLPFFAVLFFCSSCLDLHTHSENVHNFLETTLKGLKGQLSILDMVYICHASRLVALNGYNSGQHVLPSSQCSWPSPWDFHLLSFLFALVHPALFSWLTLESPVPPPKKSYCTTSLFSPEKYHLFIHQVFFELLLCARHGSEVCGPWGTYSKEGKANVMSCDLYMVIHFYVSFHSNKAKVPHPPPRPLEGNF